MLEVTWRSAERNVKSVLEVTWRSPERNIKSVLEVTLRSAERNIKSVLEVTWRSAERNVKSVLEVTWNAECVGRTVHMTLIPHPTRSTEQEGVRKVGETEKRTKAGGVLSAASQLHT